MTSNLPQREQTLTQLRNIINGVVKGVPVNVYLFGSWARKQEKRTSDIDIALYSKDKIPMKVWVELHENINDSTIPFHVDLVDLSTTNPVFIEKVMKEGIIWKDCSNDFTLPTMH